MFSAKQVHSNSLLLLTDYRKAFYSSTKRYGATLDLTKLKGLFEQHGYPLEITAFSKINFRERDYSSRYVLYQSSEDRGLHYKDYIEDILLGLSLKGAVLIPEFKLFRAHHNKVFMEIIRDIYLTEEQWGVEARGFGTCEEFKEACDSLPKHLVIKPSAGSIGADIRAVASRSSQLAYIKRISLSPHWKDVVMNYYNSVFRKYYGRRSLHRKKYIVQEYVSDLEGDYKVLAYGDKYYALYRENRPNDFRASGSGRLHFLDEPDSALLDFAKGVYSHFTAPFISLDIAKKNDKYILIEFQFVHFGNYTIEKSTAYFSLDERGSWRRTMEQPDLEREFVNSVVRYIVKIQGNSVQ